MTNPISPLRQRMIDDMTMRNLSPSTHETYIRAVAQFSAFHRRSPDKLGVEHLREYHMHLVSRGLTANSICVKMGCAEVLLWHDIAAAGHRRSNSDAPPDGSSADGTRARGGRAFAQCGTRSCNRDGSRAVGCREDCPLVSVGAAIARGS